MIAGMDFGTTHSGMALFDGQQLRAIPLNPLDPGDRVTPTVLYITNDQQITFGRSAINAYFDQNLGRPSKLEKVWVGEITQTFAELPTFVRDVYIWVDVLSPGRLFVSFKTDLSDASYAGTAIGRFFYSLEDIAAAYLYIAKCRAERALGHELNAIVLGRPVRFNENPEADALAQARLLDAALQAGYKQVYFEYEPIAAAHYYEISMTRPQNVLVFDFGGGTLDITVMRLGDPRQRQVLATGGVPIAGDHFDRKIVRAKIPRLFGEGSLYRSLDKKLPLPVWIYDAFNDWRTLLTLQQPDQMQTLRTITPTAEKRRDLEALAKLVTSNYALKLFEVVEQVKRRLSERDEAVIRLQGDGFIIREPITRTEFEQLIRPEHNIIERHLNETLQSSGLRTEQIDVVIRTGGSSQIPLFQRMLAQKFGAEKVQAIDTFGSVTAGLGIIA
ncbi:MAG: molecular chaperone, partial [Chloroflexi bacterium]